MSLAGSSVSITVDRRDPLGQRHLDDDPGDERVGVEPLDLRADRGCDEARPGTSTRRPSMPTFAHDLRIWLR